MLRNLQDEPRLATFHVQGIQDLRETLVKLRVNVNVMDGTPVLRRARIKYEYVFKIPKNGSFDSGGIRTHASEETGA